MRFRFTTTEWAKSKKVQDAWKDLAQKHGLSSDWLDDPGNHFNFLDGAMFSANPGVLRYSRCILTRALADVLCSTDKARKRGWNGYVDSYESMLEAFDDLAELKMIPPIPKTKLSFL